jgi:hypothetical protein
MSRDRAARHLAVPARGRHAAGPAPRHTIPRQQGGPHKEGMTMTSYSVHGALGTQVASIGQDLASRVVRQVLQALAPTFIVIASGSLQGVDLKGALILAGVTAVVTVLRWITDLRVPADAPTALQVADRALAAAAGAALGFFAGDLAGTAIDWSGALTAAVGAGVLAVIMARTNPPVVPAGENEDGSLDVSRLPGDGPRPL